MRRLSRTTESRARVKVAHLEKRKRASDPLRSSSRAGEPLGSEFGLLEGAALTAAESRTVGTDEHPGTARGTRRT